MTEEYSGHKAHMKGEHWYICRDGHAYADLSPFSGTRKRRDAGKAAPWEGWRQETVSGEDFYMISYNSPGQRLRYG